MKGNERKHDWAGGPSHHGVYLILSLQLDKGALKQQLTTKGVLRWAGIAKPLYHGLVHLLPGSHPEKVGLISVPFI